MNALRADAGPDESVGEPVGSMLRPREDQRLRHVFSAEQMDDERGLQLLRDGVDRLRDARRRQGLPLHLN